jgi:hypothetical protein
MPRSGTTLVEDIVARHPDGYGAGELKLGTQVLNGIAMSGTTVRTSSGEPKAMAPDERGRAYVAALEASAGTRPTRIVDKLPGNYLWLGPLETILPESYLVHCRRHPIDTCLSQYRLFFGTEIPYSYDLRDLGRAYRVYAEFMDFWTDVLPPGRILDVRYEDLVARPNYESRRLIQHLGLPWTEACLTPSEEPRTVRTASATQVRRPIYADAVGRWRAYERYLAPLLDEVGDLVETYERDALVTAE